MRTIHITVPQINEYKDVYKHIQCATKTSQTTARTPPQLIKSQIMNIVTVTQELRRQSVGQLQD